MKKEIVLPIISICGLIILIIGAIFIYNKPINYIYKINYSDSLENSYEIYIFADYDIEVKSKVECHNEKCQGNYTEPIITKYNLSELEKENLQILINKLFNGSKKEITITNSDLTEDEQIILNNLL